MTGITICGRRTGMAATLMIRNLAKKGINMAYRTYINNTQVFGNNEYYPEWTTYLKSKGIEENMNMEKERRLNKENGKKFHSSSIFDLGNIYDDVLNCPTEESLLDKEIHYLENGYMFMPYAFFKACENIIEYKGVCFKGKHIRVYQLKEGCTITVSAG